MGARTALKLATPLPFSHTGTVVRLQFWARWSTEPGYDYGQVQASTDGGRTWLPLSGGYASWWKQFVYTGWEPQWVKEEIDLSHLAGHDVLLQFQFNADGSGNGDGFYVDDIVVRSYDATGIRLEHAAALDFGGVAVGERDTMPLVLRNVGTNDLTVSNLVHSSSCFSLVNPPTLPLTLQETLDSTVLTVVCDPASHGAVDDTLFILSNDPLNPSWGVPLSGLGVLLGQADSGKMYAASSYPTSSLFTLNMMSAETTSIGRLGIREIVALSVHPDTREVYGIAAGTDLLYLYRLSSIYGQTLPAGTIPLPRSRAMAFSPGGDLFIGTMTGNLYRADVLSGDTTLVGRSPYSKYSAFAFHPKTGELWAGNFGGTQDSILRVDPVTGSATAIGRTGDGQRTLSLAFDAAGNLLGLKGEISQKTRLIRIDQSTGVGTLIDTTSVEGIIAITMWSPFTTDISSQPVAVVPHAFKLAQNYPNPFNPSTTIKYELPTSSVVRLSVYDMLGREVSVLVIERKDAGVYEVKFDASGLASGVYLYRMQAGSFVETRKLLLLR
jgi:hypothetical protein